MYLLLDLKNLLLRNRQAQKLLFIVLIFLKKKNIFYNNFILLEPTSPLTSRKDIDNAIRVFEKNKIRADALVTVSKAEQSHPVFLLKKDKNNFIKPFLNKSFDFKRRQDLSELFFFDGSLYISKIKTYLIKKTFNHNKTIAYQLEKYKYIEIDDKSDLKLVRIIKQYLKNKKK